MTAGVTTVGAVAGTAGAVIVGTGLAAGAITAAVAGVQEAKYGIATFAKKKLDGRNTKCPSGYKIQELNESR